MSTSDNIDVVCENLESCKLDVEKKISDEELFKEPPVANDCPICFIRMPSVYTGYKYKMCCGKRICSGCINAVRKRTKKGRSLCPFCRAPTHSSDEELAKRRKTRIELNDATAMFNLGVMYYQGTNDYPQDYTKALELWYRSGELGYANAYNNIGYAYNNGEGVEVDKKKANHYYELAAIRGDEMARYNLGLEEERVGNMDRALKHYLIGVKGGDNQSLKQIRWLYSNGHATKEDYTTALRSYQEYLGEIKSKQRDEAAADDQYRYY